MPEKSLTIAAYAAGASLAAATLVYVFGPTFFLDEADATAHNDRKRIAVGLTNVANDCFINSTLQALAGLPTLRLYLIRELHQRQVDGEDVYLTLDSGSEEGEKERERSIIQTRPEWLRLSLQSGALTAALKSILDALNERPVSRKTISAQPFITAVEKAFKTRVSRQQQDAQELLHLLLERLADEYYAGKRARQRAGLTSKLSLEAKEDKDSVTGTVEHEEDGVETSRANDNTSRRPEQPARQDNQIPVEERSAADERHDLPFEGKLSSQLECSACHFKPKPATTSFVTLTLNVPHHASSTSLDACLDGMLKIEQIDDFRCDRCRLEHALQVVEKQLARTSLSSEQRRVLQSNQTRITETMKHNPEHPPKDLQLPDSASAPKRRITRYMRISSFPRILAIHLSRSVWDGYSASSKNTAKVSFPEVLQLGSLVDRKRYRLLSIVTHKGGHNSGHYETFRRQWVSPPVVEEEMAVKELPPTESPRISVADNEIELLSKEESLESESHPTGVSVSHQNKSHTMSAATTRFMAQSPRLKATSQAKIADRKRKAQDRWWRISDDKVKECKLSDVLGMQKEIYLLFYELVPS